MEIEVKDVEHLASLARIMISGPEKELLRRDLAEILTYVSQVKEVAAELGDSKAGVLRNVLRADENPHETGVYTKDLVGAAPAYEDGRISVKKIL